MSDRDRSKMASLLGKAINDTERAYASINDFRTFTSLVTLSTLNGWSKIDECAVHMHLSFDGSSFYIG
jgi:hypothetical protein